jgi:endo-1,4-beta-xylanase
MRHVLAWMMVLAGMIAAGQARGEVLGVQKIPEGGKVIARSGDDPLKSAMQVGDAEHAVFSAVKTLGEAFASAVRVQTLKQPETIYAIQLVYNSAEPVKKGDVLLACFTARGTGTMGREARIEALVGKSAPDWDIFASQMMSMRPDWQRFYLSCNAANDYEPGKVYISLRMGLDPQTVEIADAQLINFGQVRKAAELPRTRVTYEGRSADAYWRKAAAERIEKFRKGDLKVRVLNADGTPAAGVAVEVKMVRQAFPFAAAVSADMIARQKGPDADRYRQMVDQMFTHVTMEWEACQLPWEQDRSVALAAFQWLKEHGKTVHGCHILWPDPNSGVPKDIVALKGNPEAMRKRLLGHIDEKLNACKGLASEWNALNELYTNRLFEETLGKQFIVEVFGRAKQIDPSLRLDINDYGDIANASNPHIEGYLDWIRYLKEKQTLVDVVGLQCHFGQFLRSPEECYGLLNRFAEFGYPLHVTELDINTTDEAAQTDYTRDILTLLYSHPAVEKITLWGFWEGRHWLPRAALWRTDWSIKPNGQAWKDLVFTIWRTQATLTTDWQGSAGVRAFTGDYEVTAMRDGKPVTGQATVTPAGGMLELRLK